LWPFAILQIIQDLKNIRDIEDFQENSIKQAQCKLFDYTLIMDKPLTISQISFS
jgi:hypothetical protein